MSSFNIHLTASMLEITNFTPARTWRLSTTERRPSAALIFSLGFVVIAARYRARA